MATQLNLSLNDLQKAGRTLLTTEEVAAILNMRPQTIYKWSCYQSGPLQSVRVGRSVKWRLCDVVKLVG